MKDLHKESQERLRHIEKAIKVKSFRNMIAHEYFNIKLSAVWLIIKTDLPALNEVIK